MRQTWHWQAVYGRYTLDRLLLPKDETHYGKYSNMINTAIPANITSSVAADGKSVRTYTASDNTQGTIALNHLLGRMSADPILSKELCAKAVAFSEANSDLWMNTGGFALPSSFVSFGNNANNMARYGNFDIVLDHFSRGSQLHVTPHAPRDILYSVSKLVSC